VVILRVVFVGHFQNFISRLVVVGHFFKFELFGLRVVGQRLENLITFTVGVDASA